MSLKGLKILYHHRTQGKGVEGVHIGEMVRAWRELGHGVDLVGPVEDAIQGKERQKGFSLNKYIYKIISRHMPEIFFEFFEIFYNFSAGKKIRKAFRYKGYDLLYERYAIFNWCGVREAKRVKIPVILEVNYTSHTPLYRKRSKLLKPLAARIEKWVLEDADGLIVVSNYLKEHLESMGIDKNKIIVLTNAANPEVFNPQISSSVIRNKSNMDGKIVIGFAGGFYPWHGLDLLLDAFKIASIKYKNIALLLIGDGPIKPYLEKKVFETGLKDQVCFTEMVPHHSLPAYIAAFDIGVMPHSNEYGSPMKIYEYMAMGKPVIASKFGPLEDGITHGKEGFLFKPGDIDELIFFLDKLIKNKTLREEMGRCGRQRIVNRHNWLNNAMSVTNFINLFGSEAQK